MERVDPVLTLKLPDTEAPFDQTISPQLLSSPLPPTALIVMEPTWSGTVQVSMAPVTPNVHGDVAHPVAAATGVDSDAPGMSSPGMTAARSANVATLHRR
jgi:hypothetical protein